MKTTEIFIEQLLIGFVVLGLLVLLACPAALTAVPFLSSLPALQTDCQGAGERHPCLFETDSVKDDKAPTWLMLGLGSLLVGLAYFVGLVYDRIADSLCTDWEGHNRLRVALKNVPANQATLPSTGDPFPADRIRYHIQKTSGLVDWADYLRSRMRLTRALATLVPALGVALATVTHTPGKRLLAVLLLIVIYSSVPLLSWIYGRLSEKKKKSYSLLIRPPKTREEDREKLQRYWDEYRGVAHEYGTRPTLWRWVLEPTCIGIWATALLTYCYAARPVFLDLSGLCAAGATAGFSILIGWVWWRISGTFFDYLRTGYCVEKEFKKDRTAWQSQIKPKAEGTV